MKWYKNLYVGEEAKKHRRTIVRKIKNRKFQLSTHVIVLPEKQEDVLEIYPAFVLLQKSRDFEFLKIIGIAADKQEALTLAEKIIMDVYKKNGSLNIKDFLLYFK
jgi:hypothetical protein